MQRSEESILIEQANKITHLAYQLQLYDQVKIEQGEMLQSERSKLRDELIDYLDQHQLTAIFKNGGERLFFEGKKYKLKNLSQKISEILFRVKSVNELEQASRRMAEILAKTQETLAERKPATGLGLLSNVGLSVLTKEFRADKVKDEFKKLAKDDFAKLNEFDLLATVKLGMASQPDLMIDIISILKKKYEEKLSNLTSGLEFWTDSKDNRQSAARYAYGVVYKSSQSVRQKRDDIEGKLKNISIITEENLNIKIELHWRDVFDGVSNRNLILFSNDNLEQQIKKIKEVHDKTSAEYTAQCKMKEKEEGVKHKDKDKIKKLDNKILKIETAMQELSSLLASLEELRKDNNKLLSHVDQLNSYGKEYKHASAMALEFSLLLEPHQRGQKNSENREEFLLLAHRERQVVSQLSADTYYLVDFISRAVMHSAGGNQQAVEIVKSVLQGLPQLYHIASSVEQIVTISAPILASSMEMASMGVAYGSNPVTLFFASMGGPFALLQDWVNPIMGCISALFKITNLILERCGIALFSDPVLDAIKKLSSEIKRDFNRVNNKLDNITAILNHHSVLLHENNDMARQINVNVNQLIKTTEEFIKTFEVQHGKDTVREIEKRSIEVAEGMLTQFQYVSRKDSTFQQFLNFMDLLDKYAESTTMDQFSNVKEKSGVVPNSYASVKKIAKNFKIEQRQSLANYFILRHLVTFIQNNMVRLISNYAAHTEKGHEKMLDLIVERCAVFSSSVMEKLKNLEALIEALRTLPLAGEGVWHNFYVDNVLTPVETLAAHVGNKFEKRNIDTGNKIQQRYIAWHQKEYQKIREAHRDKPYYAKEQLTRINSDADWKQIDSYANYHRQYARFILSQPGVISPRKSGDFYYYCCQLDKTLYTHEESILVLPENPEHIPLLFRPEQIDRLYNNEANRVLYFLQSLGIGPVIVRYKLVNDQFSDSDKPEKLASLHTRINITFSCEMFEGEELVNFSEFTYAEFPLDISFSFERVKKEHGYLPVRDLRHDMNNEYYRKENQPHKIIDYSIRTQAQYDELISGLSKNVIHVFSDYRNVTTQNNTGITAVVVLINDEVYYCRDNGWEGFERVSVKSKESCDKNVKLYGEGSWWSDCVASHNNSLEQEVTPTLMDMLGLASYSREFNENEFLVAVTYGSAPHRWLKLPMLDRVRPRNDKSKCTAYADLSFSGLFELFANSTTDCVYIHRKYFQGRLGSPLSSVFMWLLQHRSSADTLMGLVQHSAVLNSNQPSAYSYLIPRDMTQHFAMNDQADAMIKKKREVDSLILKEDDQLIDDCVEKFLAAYEIFIAALELASGLDRTSLRHMVQDSLGFSHPYLLREEMRKGYDEYQSAFYPLVDPKLGGSSANFLSFLSNIMKFHSPTYLIIKKSIFAIEPYCTAAGLKSELTKFNSLLSKVSSYSDLQAVFFNKNKVRMSDGATVNAAASAQSVKIVNISKLNHNCGLYSLAFAGKLAVDQHHDRAHNMPAIVHEVNEAMVAKDSASAELGNVLRSVHLKEALLADNEYRKNWRMLLVSACMSVVTGGKVDRVISGSLLLPANKFIDHLKMVNAGLLSTLNELESLDVSMKTITAENETDFKSALQLFLANPDTFLQSDAGKIFSTAYSNDSESIQMFCELLGAMWNDCSETTSLEVKEYVKNQCFDLIKYAMAHLISFPRNDDEIVKFDWAALQQFCHAAGKTNMLIEEDRLLMLLRVYCELYAVAENELYEQYVEHVCNNKLNPPPTLTAEELSSLAKHWKLSLLLISPQDRSQDQRQALGYVPFPNETVLSVTLRHNGGEHWDAVVDNETLIRRRTLN